MKRMITCIVMLFLVGLFVAPSSFAAPPQEMFLAGALGKQPYVQRASAIRGKVVETMEGEAVGEIEDVVFDMARGRIRYVALAYGGLLGFGKTFVAIPWEALTIQPGGETFMLTLDKEKLQNVPGFDQHDWPQWPDPFLSAALHGSAETPERSPGSPTTVLPSSNTQGVRSGKALSATIQEMDAQHGSITLRTEAGNTVALRASPALLVGLQAGDAVEVKTSGEQVTRIHKQE